jgi:hypothetical protein
MQSDKDDRWLMEPLHPLDEEIEEETDDSLYKDKAKI